MCRFIKSDVNYLLKTMRTILSTRVNNPLCTLHYLLIWMISYTLSWYSCFILRKCVCRSEEEAANSTNNQYWIYLTQDLCHILWPVPVTHTFICSFTLHMVLQVLWPLLHQVFKLNCKYNISLSHTSLHAHQHPDTQILI